MGNNPAEALLLLGPTVWSALPEDAMTSALMRLLPGARHRCWLKDMAPDGSPEPGRHCWLVYDLLPWPEDEEDAPGPDEMGPPPETALLRAAVTSCCPAEEQGPLVAAHCLFYGRLDLTDLQFEEVRRFDLPEPEELEEGEEPAALDDGLSDAERYEQAEPVRPLEIPDFELAETTLWGQAFLFASFTMELVGVQAEISLTFDPRRMPVPDLLLEASEGRAEIYGLREAGHNRVFAPLWQEGMQFKLKCKRLDPKEVLRGIPMDPFAAPPGSQETVFTVTVSKPEDGEDDPQLWLLKAEDYSTYGGELAWPVTHLHHCHGALHKLESCSEGGASSYHKPADPDGCGFLTTSFTSKWVPDLLPDAPYHAARKDEPHEQIIEHADLGMRVQLQSWIENGCLHQVAVAPAPVEVEEGEEPPPPPDSAVRWVQKFERYAPWPVSTRKERFDPESGEVSKTDYLEAELLEVIVPPEED